MANESLVEAVCSIPDAVRGYSQRPTARSAQELLAASGYASPEPDLTLQQLADYLGAHPEIVEHWTRWSEDKRVGEGWYFDAQTATVGYYSSRGHENVQRFANQFEACASFILQELASMVPRR